MDATLPLDTWREYQDFLHRAGPEGSSIRHWRVVPSLAHKRIDGEPGKFALDVTPRCLLPRSLLCDMLQVCGAGNYLEFQLVKTVVLASGSDDVVLPLTRETAFCEKTLTLRELNRLTSFLRRCLTNDILCPARTSPEDILSEYKVPQSLHPHLLYGVAGRTSITMDGGESCVPVVVTYLPQHPLFIT